VGSSCGWVKEEKEKRNPAVSIVRSLKPRLTRSNFPYKRIGERKKEELTTIGGQHRKYP